MEVKLNTLKRTLQRKEFEAKEAERRKNELVVYLAHDLKTPLTSVMGYLNLLHDEEKISPELQKKYLSVSIDKAERLEELINEFFEITRLNLQTENLQISKVNLTMLLAQLVDEFYPLFSAKKIRCECAIDDGLLIYGDADKLARVFDNILRNAVNYSYEQSVIQIFASHIQNGVSLRFINHGDMIPQEKLERIFEKFFRLDTSRSSKTGGSGLGLAISKRIVELHHGDIVAKSNENGTEFSVFLPFGEQ